MSGDGGPAFPVPEIQYEGREGLEVARVEDRGMTLRDYFAAKVAAAIISSPRPITYEGAPMSAPSEIARSAYLIANAMLEARKT